MLTISPNFVQERALKMLRSEWKKYNSFLIYAPTGSGKTGISAFIIDGFVSKGMKVLFVVPLTILITQTAQRFISYGLSGNEITYIWRDHANQDPSKPIQIASADTLIRRKFPTDIDLLIIDEAHLKKRKILKKINYLINKTNCKVIGLSGTPFAAFLGHYYQKLIKPTTIKELIKRGDLSDYELFTPTKPDLTGVKSTNDDEFGNDYCEADIAEIMCGSDLVGDIVTSWLKLGENQPTICFCVNVSHANFITIKFNQAAINAEIITAKTPHDERQLILHRFRQGATKILVNVGVLSTGFDDDVRCIIYARPTKSEIRWIQTLGRGLRKAPGKEKCIILDHSGTYHLLGCPDDIEYDELFNKDNGLKGKKHYLKQEKLEKFPIECSLCNYKKPAGVYVCPNCGFKPLIGKDVKVDANRNIKKINKKDRKHTQLEKQSFWSQLLYYINQRATQGKPISPGWAAHIYKNKFGTWPTGLHDTPQELTPVVSNYIRYRQIAFGKSRRKNEKNKPTFERGGLL